MGLADGVTVPEGAGDDVGVALGVAEDVGDALGVADDVGVALGVGETLDIEFSFVAAEAGAMFASTGMPDTPTTRVSATISRAVRVNLWTGEDAMPIAFPL